jgi:hypothetical protein
MGPVSRSLRSLVRDDSGICRFSCQTAESIPAARFRPGYAISFAPSRVEGAGKAGCRRHPQHRVQWVEKDAHGFDRYSQDIPAFPAQWFDGLLRALPGERPLLPPLPRCHRAARIDARVAAPGPHDFTGRLLSVSSGEEAPDARSGPSQPAPRFVTTRNVPHGGTGWECV